MRIISILLGACLFVAIFHGVGRTVGLNAEMTKFIRELEDQAKTQDSSFQGFTAEKGKKLFFDAQPNVQTGTISCTTCHTTDLKMSGKTLVGKVLEPEELPIPGIIPQLHGLSSV